MNEQMRTEILDQPAAVTYGLPRLRAQLERCDLRDHSADVVFTGSGDSLLAPVALTYAARVHAGTRVSALHAFDAAHYVTYTPDTLVVAISVSGEASGTTRAARAAREAGATVLAITANATSTLARVGSAVLTFELRSTSRKTPHTTEFLLSLLAVAAVVEWLGRTTIAVLAELPRIVDQLVRVLEEPCRKVATTLADRDRFYFLGAGPSFGVAQYGAAKFWEAGGVDAHAFELEEFAHGPHLLLESGDPVVLVAPRGESSERAAEIAAGVADLGGRVVAITDAREELGASVVIPVAALREEWSPFATAVAVQWLCWAIATAKEYDVVRKDGRHADAAKYELAHRRWFSG